MNAMYCYYGLTERLQLILSIYQRRVRQSGHIRFRLIASGLFQYTYAIAEKL